jgi:ribosomal protein L34
MKVKIRLSSTKARRMTGFRTRMKTAGGRAIINRQRARAMGAKKKRN